MAKDVTNDFHVGLSYSFVVITGDAVDVYYDGFIEERYSSGPIGKDNQLNQIKTTFFSWSST